jgi:hypothetical protein
MFMGMMMNNLVQKHKLIDLKSKLNQMFDLFICSCSFEERCLSIPRNINNNVKDVALMYNKEYQKYFGGNLASLKELFHDKFTIIELVHSNPILSADSINKHLSRIIKNKKGYSILLDITTFTHEILLILFRIFQIVCPDANITCIYANASEYDPDNGQDAKWLSKGIKEIRSVLGYQGNIIPTQKTHLIVIVGYEYERAAAIINTLEPYSLALGYGRTDDATTDKDKDANEHYLQLVKKMAISFSNIKTFEIKCDNPFDTYEVLSNYIGNLKDINIIIIPLNNKISTVGVVLTAIKNDNIQLCYAPAMVYNYSDYSNPGEYCYVFKISEILNDN